MAGLGGFEPPGDGVKVHCLVEIEFLHYLCFLNFRERRSLNGVVKRSFHEDECS